MNNEKSKNGNKKTILFKTASKIIKYLGMNLTMEEKDLYTGNSKYYPPPKLKKDISKWKSIS